MKTGSVFRDRFFWVIAAFILIFTATAPGSASDETRMAFVESVLSRHEIWIERSPYANMYDSMFKDGHLISDKPYLLSIYSVIVLFPIHLFIQFDTEASKAVLYYTATLSVSGLPILALLYYLKRVHRLLGGDDAHLGTAAYCVVLSTPMLPFLTMYNNHVLEGAILLAAFYHLLDFRMNRRANSGWICGALLGTGILTQIVAPFVFTVLTGAYFVVRSRAGAVRFAVAVIVLVLLGMGINYALHRDVRPQYFMQQYYYHPHSAALIEPRTPRMSYEQLKDRLTATKTPEAVMKRTLERYNKHKEDFRNPLVYARSLWPRHDFMFFLNPVVFLALLALLSSVWRSGGSFRTECAWVLLGASMVYVLLILIRAIPGGSFGNRYLIPVVPVVACFVATQLQTGSSRIRWIRVSAVLAFAMMLPGVLRPWFVPSELFRLTNLAICSVWALLSVIVWTSSSVRTAVDALLKTLFDRRPVLAAAGLCLIVFEFWVYNGMHDWAALLHSFGYWRMFVFKFLVWSGVSAGIILLSAKKSHF